MYRGCEIDSLFGLLVETIGFEISRRIRTQRIRIDFFVDSFDFLIWLKKEQAKENINQIDKETIRNYEYIILDNIDSRFEKEVNDICNYIVDKDNCFFDTNNEYFWVFKELVSTKLEQVLETKTKLKQYRAKE